MASVSRGARRLVASRGRDLARCLSSDAPLPASPEAYCQELVQKADYDGYLTSLLLRPREVKPAVYAVRAFNVETATIKEAVRGNLAPGRLRLQWWRDVVASIYKWGGEAKPPQQHPIAAALADAIENRCLSRAYLDRMLDARLGDIEGNEHQSMSDLEAYAEQTASSMLHLTLEAIGLKEDRQLMVKHDVSPSLLFKGAQTEKEANAIAECAYDLAVVAKGHMDAAQAMCPNLSDEAFRALLPGVRVAWYLTMLEKHGFDMFAEELSPARHTAFQWRVAKATFSKSFGLE